MEKIRRAAEALRLMVDAGLIVSGSLTSHCRSEHGLARSLFEPGEYSEGSVDVSLDACVARDRKRLYAKAIPGRSSNFTSCDSTSAEPERLDLRLNPEKLSTDMCVELVVRSLG